MQDRPPYHEDFFQRIINVNWGAKDVIVVFSDNGTANASPTPSTYTPSPDKKVELLKTFDVQYQEGGFQPGMRCSAYKVSRDAGEFMTTVWPGIPEINFTAIDVFVFAINGTVDDSMQRVMDGMKLIQPAMYVGYDPAGHGDSDIPYDIHPPGVLWGISVTIVAGRTYTWKIRFGDHRAGGSTEPPNSMVQCYPLGPSFSLSGIEVTGYLIWIYRLDKSGTGIFYGMDPDYIIGPSPQIIDPAWHQIVISTGFFGIPFQDPPPLIGADI